ncbi:MAG: murein biosynthesis integral membrane protein MurJ [Oscillospiraceae bacterium]|nr:murein biosynthesis integral membrane protein MurJ [Oscillospiraceae bacterium]
MKKKKSSVGMIQTAGFMAMATLLSKGLGLVRNSMLTAYFGSGMESDAFLTASTLPTTLFDIVIGGVISASFIPVFNSIMSKRGKDDAMKFLNKFVTLILCISALIAVFGIVFSSPLVSLQTNYDGEKHALAARLTAIMFPMLIFTGLAFSFVGLLQSFGEYKIPSLISLVSNLAIILYYVTLGKRFGIYGLAVTMVIAWSLQFLIQIPWIRKFGVKFRFDFKFKDSDIKQTLLLAGPMLIATWVQPLYSIVNQRFASNIDSAVTYIQQSYQLYIMVVGVFSFVVTNLIFPKLVQAVARDDIGEAKNLTVSSIRAIVLVIAPLMAGFMILSKPISSIIYGYGKMDEEGVTAISMLLKFYSVGMMGLGLNEVLSKAFFSLKDSKTPMRNSVISMVINIALAYVLYKLMSTNGLALAAACGSVINAALNWICMARKYPGMVTRADAADMLKSVISAAVMGVCVMLIYRAVSGFFTGIIGNIAVCAVCGVSGVIIYGILIVLMGERDVKNLLHRKG